ncbi:hypothetical protein A1A1_13862 [Planococcus antarcticus DSM 14505]|uniref:Uncharacterized protein n=2 Tax=Planococcus TaxID=1372 RepID=A0AA87IK93_9BACL|nr:hypothetical protein A1A1_13862 [Planococcus antarcticus DSM 14505]
MNIFQMKTKPHNQERLNDFIQGKFIAIGWPGIGNLEGASKEEVRKRLADKYSYESSRSLGNDLGNVWAFSETMKNDDIVFFQGHQNDVYIIKVGPYEYEKKYDNEEGMAHQRKFVLLKVVKKYELNSKIQELLRNRSAITKFKYALEEAELGFLEGESSVKNENVLSVGNDILLEALEIVCKELKSENEDRRFQAAVELLRFTK